VLLLGQMPATLSQHLNNMHYDYEVDATGLKCPLPILRCKKGLNEIKSDQVLKIIATDPGSKKILMHSVVRQGMSFYLFKMKMVLLLSLSRNVV
jgi:TusA-related sulfurtransferase